MPYQLVISKQIEFPIRWTLRDGAKDRVFEITASCNRISVDAEKKSWLNSTDSLDVVLRRFLLGDDLALRMLAWSGEPYMVDEDGKAAPPGDATLRELLGHDGMLQAFFKAIEDANSVKAKLGN